MFTVDGFRVHESQKELNRFSKVCAFLILYNTVQSSNDERSCTFIKESTSICKNVH